MPATVPRYLRNFRLAHLPRLHTDVVVLGTGVAGLQAARAVARGEVLVLSKGAWDVSNTAQAQGGIAVALGADDSAAGHVADTLATGAGLADEKMVGLLVHEGVERTRELMAAGLAIDSLAGQPDFGREGAHSAGRVIHIGGDATGRGLVNFLHREVRARPNLRVLEHTLAVDLLVADGFCVGVLVLDINSKNLLAVMARATILATGGAQRLYREATGSEITTGDGLAMAYRAGATLRDMEFMQFHPTALYLAGAPRFLLSEAMRGDGGVLVNARGERFMERYTPQGELAARDIVSRAILEEMARTKTTSVFLDVTGLGRARLWSRFPTIARFCQQYNLDIATAPIPVRPAAHYFIGGIAVDEWGRTGVPGLYAAGEVASTGVHGANRLASNSLLEGLVFGARAGQAAGEYARSARGPESPPLACEDRPAGEPKVELDDMRNSLQSLMWRRAGIFRAAEDLGEARAKIALWSSYVFAESPTGRAGIEMQNMLLVADLIATAALWREESRGTHYRTDYPPPAKDEFARHCDLRRPATPEP